MYALICTVPFYLTVGDPHLDSWMMMYNNYYLGSVSIHQKSTWWGFFARCIPTARSRLQAEMKMQNSQVWWSVPNPSKCFSFDVSGKT